VEDEDYKDTRSQKGRGLMDGHIYYPCCWLPGFVLRAIFCPS